MQAGRSRVRVRGGGSREAWELTVSAAAESGGCEPAAASAPAAFRPAPRRGRRRPQRGAGLLPFPRNLGGRGPETGAPGDVTARAGSTFWRRGRLRSRVSAAAAAGRNVGECVALGRGARGACGGWGWGGPGGRAGGRFLARWRCAFFCARAGAWRHSAELGGKQSLECKTQVRLLVSSLVCKRKCEAS